MPRCHDVPQLAKRGEIDELRRCYGPKGTSFNNECNEESYCKYCRRSGHTLSFCDSFPMVRPMRTAAQTKFLKFMVRLDPAKIPTVVCDPESAIWQLPAQWAEFEARVAYATAKWNAPNPFDKQNSASFPLHIRRKAIQWWAIGASSSALQKIIYGDESLWISRSERRRYKNVKSCFTTANKAYLDRFLMELMSHLSLIP